MNVKLFQQLAAAKLEVVAKLKTSQGGLCCNSIWKCISSGIAERRKVSILEMIYDLGTFLRLRLLLSEFED